MEALVYGLLFILPFPPSFPPSLPPSTAPQPSSQRPIRVPTIVSPGESLLLASLMKVRRGEYALERLRKKAQEKMEVQRPAAVDGSAQEW